VELLYSVAATRWADSSAPRAPSPRATGAARSITWVSAPCATADLWYQQIQSLISAYFGKLWHGSSHL